MLSTVFRWKLHEISTSPVLRDLLRSFSINNPVPNKIYPRWDLSKVLQALSSAPYEPLGAASFRDLTKKTLFLIALATAKRVGELQAISPHVAWIGGDVSLCYLPAFVAKTETPTNPLPRSFVIKSLSSFVGRDDVERLLCPVRALKYYLEATRSVSPRPSVLFVSPRDHLGNYEECCFLFHSGTH